VTSVGMSDLVNPSLASRLGRWFEQRLVECPPAPSPTPRMYGLEIVDADGIESLSPTAVRVVYLGDCAHDAVAIVQYAESVDRDEVHDEEHVDAGRHLQCRVALAVEHL
jgi:hypothetical protein